MHPYVQSFVWLVGFGGLGYVLMEITKPSESKLNEIRNVSDRHLLSERDQKKALFMQKLEEATTGKPIYLKGPQELAEDNKKRSDK